MYVDRMGVTHEDGENVPDYGSLYIISRDLRNVCEFGGSDTSDAEKLSMLTSAAAGSTCLFSNGDIYRLELDGWAKFGEEEETAAASNSASPASLNLSPLDINRNDLMNKTGSSDIEETPEEMTVEPIIDNEDMV